MDMLGATIKELRRAAGMGREQLADAAGISSVFLTKIEQGKRRPSPQKLTAIARALDASPQDLSTRAELFAASAAPTDEEMRRRLLRAGAVVGGAGTVGPLVGAAISGVFGPAGTFLGAGAAIVTAAAIRNLLEREERADSDEPAPPLGLEDMNEVRRLLVAQIEAMPDGQLAEIARSLHAPRHDVDTPHGT